MNSDLLAKVALQITLDVRREPFVVDTGSSVPLALIAAADRREVGPAAMYPLCHLLVRQGDESCLRSIGSRSVLSICTSVI